MKTAKQVLLGLFLATLAPLAGASAQAQSSATATTDSLIVLSEEELVERLRSIAEAARQQQTRSTVSPILSAEQLQLLRYQLLLSAIATPRTSTTVTESTAGYEARLTRIETLLEQLLTSSSQAEGTTTRTVRRSRSTQPTVITRSTGQSGAVILPQLAPSLTSAPVQTSRTDTVYVAPAADNRYSALEAKLDALLSSQLTGSDSTPTVVRDTIVELRTDTIQHTIYSPIGFKRQVFFAVGSSKIGREGEAALSDVLRLMQKDTTLCLRLTGYSSPEGNAQLNARLSQARGEAVRSWLTRHGVDASRLRTEQGGVDDGTDLRTLARRVDVELFR